MEKFIQQIAKQAGAILKKGFGKKHRLSEKTSRWDFVTQYDLAAEQFLVNKIKRKYPQHGILAEESGGQIEGKKEFWIIDPLDGTRGFARGLPQFTVCIVFVRDDIIERAAVYDPMQSELFYAARNKGAFLNGRRIKVAEELQIDHSFFAYHVPLSQPFGKYRRWLRDLLYKEAMVGTKTTSAQLSGAYVAAGRYDALLMKGLHPWDMAASALLIKEAGGKVTNFSGKPYKWNNDEILAANPIFHQKLLQKTREL